MSESTFIAYMDAAEGLISDQQRLIDQQRETIEMLLALFVLVQLKNID